jgi:hypothetical protein
MAERLVARNSPFKQVLILLPWPGLLVVTIWGERLGIDPDPDWADALVWLRWPIALFLIYATALTARRLFDRRPQIVVDREGIFLRRWSERIIPWTAIKSIRAVKHRLPRTIFFYQRFICLDLHDPVLYPRTTSRILSFGNGWDYGLGDITMIAVGLDQEYPELMAAIRPHAAAAGIAVTEL